MPEGMGWSVDAEGRGDCERIDRTRRREVRRQRVNDGSLGRLMGQWRRAGVMDSGVLTHPETGVGPGGVLSPVLANIFLHHVLDAWCAREGPPRLQGRRFRTRCADDCVIGCERAADAQQIMGGCPTRCARVGRRMPPTQTTRVVFREAHSQPGSGAGERPRRVSRLHPCLGTHTSGVLGPPTQHRQDTAPASPAGVVAMVSPPSSGAPAIPVSEAVREATRARSVRRSSGQLPSAGARPPRCGEGVARRAESASPHEGA
jgi:hypothetical protein